MRALKTLIASAALAMGVAGHGVVHAVPVTVALELALVIDVSGSVDANEYNLQRNGYATAFQSAAIGTAIESFASAGGIAVAVYYFANNSLEMLPWTQLTTAVEAAAFGASIFGLARPDLTDEDGFGELGRATNIAQGIDRGRLGIAGNDFAGSRLVIDVSGDGRQNTARAGGAEPGCGFEGGGLQPACLGPLLDARADAAAAGITINGLAITNDIPDLATYYTQNVITAGGFALAATFETFSDAVAIKIGREIIGTVPTPGTLALVGLALFAAGVSARRRA